MIIVGAKGFAKELLEIFHQKKDLNNLVFYDDVNYETGNMLFDKFHILRNEDEAIRFINTKDQRFTLGIGNPFLRRNLYDKFIEFKGKFTSSISDRSFIGSYDVHIEDGVNILDGVCISNSVSIKKGCIIYYNSIITHDCEVGEFVEISPGVTLLGGVKVGDFSQIGSGTIILPKIQIGKNVIIGAGAVVTTNIPDNTTVVGIPARVIKK